MRFVISWCLLAVGLASDVGGYSDNLPDIGVQVVRLAFQKARDRVNEENQKISPLRREPGDAAVRQSVQQFPTPRALAATRLQVLFEEATRILSERYGLTKEQIAEGLPSLDLLHILRDGTVEECQAAIAVNCSNLNQKFRTMDGSCNNKMHPTWGMASSCFNALTGAHYSDGISEFRLSTSGSSLPNARNVSLKMHDNKSNPSKRHPHMMMMVAEFLAHDVAWTPTSVDGMNNSLGCCPAEEDSPRQCAPIETPEEDDFYRGQSISCLNFVRAAPCATCALGPRKITNQATSFVDLSHVYGPNDDIFRDNRALDGSGHLRTSTHNGMTLLPKSLHPESDACSYQNPELMCFHAGDVRVNQHPSLTSMHTIFVRYHNMIVDALRDINPHWNCHRTLLEARRIVGAQWQMVVYGEFLPEVLGPQKMLEYNLRVLGKGYTRYDPTQDPTMSPEFTVAGFRFGHSIVNKEFARVSASRNDSVYLKDIYFFPFEVYQKGVDEYIKGLAESQSQKFDNHMTRGVTRHMYQERGGSAGLDLAATNIQRGRDVGLPSYTEMVRFCGGPEIETFQDLFEMFKDGNCSKLVELYQSPKDIDLVTGGACEKPLPDAMLGFTFSCILGTQLRRTKFGDRYYFEHGFQDSSFTPIQLTEIRKTKLSGILCQGSTIPKLQPNVLRYKSDDNMEVLCETFPKIDLSLWKEEI